MRNERYKLIHFFNSTAYTSWYEPTTELADDDGPNTSMCSTTAPVATLGNYVMALFDLQNDPYERINLYDQTSSEIQTAKAELYRLVDTVTQKARQDDIRSYKSLITANDVWKTAGNYIVPYLSVDADYYSGIAYSTTYPELCIPNTIY